MARAAQNLTRRANYLFVSPTSLASGTHAIYCSTIRANRCVAQSAGHARRNRNFYLESGLPLLRLPPSAPSWTGVPKRP